MNSDHGTGQLASVLLWRDARASNAIPRPFTVKLPADQSMPQRRASFRFEEVDPDCAAIRKMKAFEKYFGIDKLSDAMVMRIAAHKLPPGRVHSTRMGAVGVILYYSLPYPVL